MKSFLAILALFSPPGPLDERVTYLGMTVDEWVAALRDGTSRDPHQVLRALGEFGPAARGAVPELVRQLDGPGGLDASVIEAVGRIGPDAAPAVPILLKTFVDDGCHFAFPMKVVEPLTGVRLALARIGKPAVPGLIGVLDGPNGPMRDCAAQVLGEIGPDAEAAVPALIRALDVGNKAPDPQAESLRDDAIDALGKIGPAAAPAVPALRGLIGPDLLQGPAEALERIGVVPIPELVDSFLTRDVTSATKILQRLGPRARDAIPALRKALADPRKRRRTDAAEVLAFVDPTATEVMPILIEGLAMRPNQLAIGKIPDALARIGPPAREAIPALIAKLKTGDANDTMARALIQIDPEAKECLPALIDALSHPDPDVAGASAECLGLLGPRARAAVPALAVAILRVDNAGGGFGLGTLQDEYDFAEDPVQVLAVKALRRIGPEAKGAIPALSKALELPPPPADADQRMAPDANHAAAVASAELLGDFGPEAKLAVPVLIKALLSRGEADRNWQVRQAAALALGRIGPAAKSAIPFLRRMLTEEDRRPVAAAVIALSQLTPEGKAQAEAWANASDDPDARAWVLSTLGKPSFEADTRTRFWLTRLDRNLAAAHEEGYDEARFTEGYFQQLGRLGVGARLAIPRLNALRSHSNPWIRRRAEEILREIAPHAESPGR